MCIRERIYKAHVAQGGYGGARHGTQVVRAFMRKRDDERRRGGRGGMGCAREESGSSGMGTVDGWTKGETFFQGFPRGCCF